MDKPIDQRLYGQKRIYNQPIVGAVYRQRLKAMLGAVSFQKEDDVLDVGCEHGILLYHLSKVLAAERLTGIDCNDSILKTTRSIFSSHPPLQKVTLLTGDVLHYNFSGKRFDKICATSVLEHIQDLSLVGPTIAALLKPSGMFIVLSPHETWFYEALRKVFGYTKPIDHFHTSTEITSEISKHIRHIRTIYYPPIARLYKIDVFQQEVYQHDCRLPYCCIRSF